MIVWDFSIAERCFVFWSKAMGYSLSSTMMFGLWRPGGGEAWKREIRVAKECLMEPSLTEKEV